MSGLPYDRSADGPPLVISIPPPVRSVLHVSGVMRLESPHPPPNLWLRCWQRVLLGWRWEKVP